MYYLRDLNNDTTSPTEVGVDQRCGGCGVCRHTEIKDDPLWGRGSRHSTPFLLHYHLSLSHLHALSPLTIPPPPPCTITYHHSHSPLSPLTITTHATFLIKNRRKWNNTILPNSNTILLSYVHCTTVHFNYRIPGNFQGKMK